MKESKNKVVIEGILSENKLERKTSQAGKNYITGSLLVETGENNVVPVDILVFELKKDGGKNKVYASTETIIDTYKSIAEVGRELADKVRLTTAEISANEFYPQDGTFVSNSTVKGLFVNRVEKGKSFNPRATFEVEIFIESVLEEMNKQEELTGRIKLKGLIVGYKGRLVPVEFVVPEGKGADFIDQNYAKGQTATVSGRIVNSSVTETVEREFDGFGDSIVEDKTTYTRELIVERGTHAEDAGEAGAFSIADMNKYKEQRKIALAEMKAKAEDYAKNKEKDSYESGFDGDSATPSNKGDYATGF